MNVLIIGGSRFVGRHITDALIARGHRVTHFNRGQSDPAGRDDVEIVHGDRAVDLERLGEATWDVVFDMCGYTPDIVEYSCRYFADRTGRYVFISTVSVYDSDKTNGADEDAALLVLPPGVDRTVLDFEHYGALKALCEDAVRNTFRHRASILRPGLVAGPYDPTDRFTYWPVRIAADGTVLAPVSADEPLQYIDARDLARFSVHIAEGGDGGTYNCVTPRGSLRFGELLKACARAAHSGASFVWVDAEFLQENQVESWSDVPLWIPQGHPHRSITNADSSRAIARGLKIRPLPETVRDTLLWAGTAEKQLGSLKAGLSPERERELLSAYRLQASADR
jgi:2'-hydroxyisoflavone reductase